MTKNNQHNTKTDNQQPEHPVKKRRGERGPQKGLTKKQLNELSLKTLKIAMTEFIDIIRKDNLSDYKKAKIQEIMIDFARIVEAV